MYWDFFRNRGRKEFGKCLLIVVKVKLEVIFLVSYKRYR